LKEPTLIELGAPAIAIVAALALAVELENADLSKFLQLRLYIAY
jgi:methylthioribose-1-phosphate isomerase